jgi:hypothetical protein
MSKGIYLDIKCDLEILIKEREEVFNKLNELDRNIVEIIKLQGYPVKFVIDDKSVDVNA